MFSRDRFDNYRSIVARFASLAACGHQVKAGDPIGYNPRLKKTVCTDCWRRWVAENAEAEVYESNLPW
jgi:hypothetical protein